MSQSSRKILISRTSRARRITRKVRRPLIDRMDDLGYAFLWEDDLPEMTAWLARIRERPSFAAAFYPGARISERYPDYFRPVSELKAERGY